MYRFSIYTKGVRWVIVFFCLLYSLPIFYLSLPYWRNLEALSYPRVEGQVQYMGFWHNFSRGSTQMRQFQQIRVSFTWEGKAYTATREGLHITPEIHERMKRDDLCTVYVNQSKPEQSLLSAGLSPMTYVIGGSFFLLALYLTVQAWRNLRVIFSRKAGCKSVEKTAPMIQD